MDKQEQIYSIQTTADEDEARVGPYCHYIFLLFLLVIFLTSCGNFDSEGGAKHAPELSLPQKCQSLPLDIVGVCVTPHVYSKELRYWTSPSKKSGALVRIVVTNRDTVNPINLRLRFNGWTPEELLSSEQWTWYEMPENKRGNGKSYALGAGKTDIFTFNGKCPPWSAGNSFTLTVMDGENGTAEERVINIVPGSVQVMQVTFLGLDANRPYADNIIIHTANNSDSPLRIVKVQLYTPESDGLSASMTATRMKPFPANGLIAPKDRGGITAHFGDIPLVRGMVRIDLQDAGGKPYTVWAPRFFGKQQFDIGSGWLEIPTEKGIVPLTRESYLKLLRRMQVNMAHIESIPGYTDSISEDGLYTRYPLRMMSFFADVDRYNSDEWVMKIHGVDALGEPQLDKTPMQTYEALKGYASARYPVTITFSEDKGFRYYAGIADFPHFDAYQVNAGSADEWFFYTRWGFFRRMLWGSPLEGIGEMTRTLNAVNRPAPIAAWSQHTHEGWFGHHSNRKHPCPTPDEILIQAYEALANGAKALYWYSLQSWSLLMARNTIDVTIRTGREIRMLEDLYMTGDAYRHERIDTNGSPSLDLSSIITPAHALLFAIDLEYKPNRKEQVFEFAGPRQVSVSFELPGYLQNPKYLFRVDADGVHEVKWKATSTGVTVDDTLNKVAIYVATSDEKCHGNIIARHQNLLKKEQEMGFNPAENDDDFKKLLNDLGYNSLDEIVY